MISYPNISPDIVRFSILGLNLQVRWYGLLYVISFVIAFFMYKHTLRLRDVKLSKEQYESVIFHMMLGVILGGRLGYVIFYNLWYYLQHPLQILTV